MLPKDIGGGISLDNELARPGWRCLAFIARVSSLYSAAQGRWAVGLNDIFCSYVCRFHSQERFRWATNGMMFDPIESFGATT
jgi:hypothetical protein